MASLSLTLTVQPRGRGLERESQILRHSSFTKNVEAVAYNSSLPSVPKHKPSSRLRWMGFTIATFRQRASECLGQTPQLFDNSCSNNVESTSRNLVDWTFNGQYDGEKAVLIDASNPRRVLSKDLAKKMVVALTGAFHAGSTVCLHLENDITYPVLTLAILASGCVWTGTNTAYKAAELEHHLKLSNTQYVITAHEHLHVVNEAVKMAGILVEVIVFEDLLVPEVEHTPYYPSSIRRLGDLVRPDNQTRFDALQAQVHGKSLAFLMQTSGTTGRPKLAFRTHEAMMLELESTQDNNADKPYEPNYFMRRFHQTFAQKVHEFRITETFGAPPMLLLLAQQTQHHSLLQTLRMVAYGGAHLGAEVRQKFLSIFDVEPRLVPVYGMTEGGWFSMLKYPEVCNDGSIGRPIAGVEFDIALSDTITDHSNGPVGELLVRSRQVMEGYFADPDASAGAFINGWLRTGDIGYIKGGKVYVIDRVKDLIKTNGWQVGPAELEDALLRSADVTDCAVFGIGTDVAEHPVACIVASCLDVTEAGIRTHLSSCLASYKHNRCEIKFVDAIPKSAAGKILRKVLREQMEGLKV